MLQWSQIIRALKNIDIQYFVVVANSTLHANWLSIHCKITVQLNSNITSNHELWSSNKSPACKPMSNQLCKYAWFCHITWYCRQEYSSAVLCFNFPFYCPCWINKIKNIIITQYCWKIFWCVNLILLVMWCRSRVNQSIGYWQMKTWHIRKTQVDVIINYSYDNYIYNLQSIAFNRNNFPLQ